LEGEFITLAELARRANSAESTARRYIKNFPEYFPTRQEGQRILYASEGASVLLEIARYYSKGYTTGQVREKLTGAFKPFYDVEDTSLVDRTQEKESRERLTSILERLADYKDDTERIRKELEKERETRERNEAELYRQLQELRQEKEGQKVDRPLLEKIKKFFGL